MVFFEQSRYKRVLQCRRRYGLVLFVTRRTAALLLIIMLGLALRLWLATGPHNIDIVTFSEVGEIFRSGQNVYQVHPIYNFSPLPHILFGLLGTVSSAVGLPFSLVERAFLSIIDLLTLFVLLRLAAQRHLSSVKTAALFFLNPASIIITGHHGQIDSISILFLLIGIYLSALPIRSPWLNVSLVWLPVTAGLTFKHSILPAVLHFWMRYAKRRWQGLALFGASVLVFLASFFPYLSALERIRHQVFEYTGTVGAYGISYFVRLYCDQCITPDGRNLWLELRSLFMVSMVLFALVFRTKDIARSCLAGFLFFLTFTSGIGAQYFVFPIALGALFPTKWFYLYTIIAGMFCLGNRDELNIAAFQFVTFQVVWLFAGLWFLSELLIACPSLRRLYNNLYDNC